MTNPKPGGLRNPPGGRPPKPVGEKYRRILITLPPQTVAALETVGNKSDFINQAIIEKLERIEK